MNETETPILHISGTIPIGDFRTAARAYNLRRWLKVNIFYILFMFLVVLGQELYYLYPDLRDGYLTLRDCPDILRDIAISLLSNRFFMFSVIGYLVFMAVYFLVIIPNSIAKKEKELNPSGASVNYNFFEDHLMLSKSGQNGEASYQLKYADLRPKFRETKYTFTISTGRKNLFNIYKTIMTAQEAESVRGLLKSRCARRGTGDAKA